MIIKKFQANTETEAIMLAKEELGKDAIVMNIKTITPRGFFKFFKKSTVEITAAVDEYLNIKNDKRSYERNYERKYERNYESKVQDNSENDAYSMYKDQTDHLLEEHKNFKSALEKSETSAIEMKLNNLQSMLEKQLTENANREISDKRGDKIEEDHKNLTCVQLIYNQLLNNEVDEKFANQILGEIEPTIKKDSTVDSILAGMYQKIILKLGQAKTLEITEGKTKFVFFIGPTGVGKTTTIAKLASSIKMEGKGKIALVTSDTYRIAAVEQLRTYATILDIPLRVVYSEAEMPEIQEDFKDYDIVLIDTAGRSHKSREQRDDLEELIHSIPEEDKEVYLVLSATTKYKDLIKITDTYSQISNFRLIFTKLDETSCIGNIFNIKMVTGAPLSYATFGQNVPDDIAKIDAQNIAKQLLGGNE